MKEISEDRAQKLADKVHWIENVPIYAVFHGGSREGTFIFEGRLVQSFTKVHDAALIAMKNCDLVLVSSDFSSEGFTVDDIVAMAQMMGKPVESASTPIELGDKVEQ